MAKIGVPWCLGGPSLHCWGLHDLSLSVDGLLAFAAKVCSSRASWLFLFSLVRSWGSLLPIQLHLHSHWSCRPPRIIIPGIFTQTRVVLLQCWLCLRGHPSNNQFHQAFSSLNMNLRGACGNFRVPSMI